MPSRRQDRIRLAPPSLRWAAGAAERGQFGAAFVGPAGHEQHRAGLSPLSQAPGYRSRDEAPGAGMSSPASSGVASVLPAGASGHDQAGSYAQDGL